MTPETTRPARETCWRCAGTGYVEVLESIEPGIVYLAGEPCDVCAAPRDPNAVPARGGTEERGGADTAGGFMKSAADPTDETSRLRTSLSEAREHVRALLGVYEALWGDDGSWSAAEGSLAEGLRRERLDVTERARAWLGKEGGR